MPTTLTLAFLLAMAVLMMDSGMITNIANGLVRLTGEFYPLLSPFIGVLGAFITGSNTNSNVIFGSLQETVANALSMSAAAMCAAQSIGGSVGGAVGPTTVTLSATAAQIQGQEYKVYKKTIGPVIGTVIVLGIANYCLNLMVF